MTCSPIMVFVTAAAVGASVSGLLLGAHGYRLARRGLREVAVAAAREARHGLIWMGLHGAALWACPGCGAAFVTPPSRAPMPDCPDCGRPEPRMLHAGDIKVLVGIGEPAPPRRPWWRRRPPAPEPERGKP